MALDSKDSTPIYMGLINIFAKNKTTLQNRYDKEVRNYMLRVALEAGREDYYNALQTLFPQATSYMGSTFLFFPDRGPWGDPNYRGNFTGHIPMFLFQFHQPHFVMDLAVGGGTTKDVADQLGIEGYFTDLNPKWGGNDVLTSEPPCSADMIIYHPPYEGIIKYSGYQYGHSADLRDLSHLTGEKFIQALNQSIARQLLYLKKPDSRLVIVIGDIRGKKIPGGYRCLMKDIDWPGEPERVFIKGQFNNVSDNKYYGPKHIPTLHEYVIILRRGDCQVVKLRRVFEVEVDLWKHGKRMPWFTVVRTALEKLGGKASLQEIYQVIEGHVNCQTNKHWQARVREVLQSKKDFAPVSRGVWKLSYVA